MSKLEKLNRIDAEIARIEVEYELESGNNCGRSLGVGLSGREHSVMNLSGAYFGWMKSKPQAKAGSEAARLKLFVDNVMTVALNKLNTEQVDVRAAAGAAVQNSVSGIGPVQPADFGKYVNFAGFVYSHVKPSASYTFTFKSLEGNERQFIIFVFVDASSVKYRILKVIPDFIPSITIIQEREAWYGDAKSDYDGKARDMVTVIVHLYNTVDDKLKAGAKK